jgi:putative transposase
MAFPREHWRSLRTDNPLERVMRELRRRTRVVGNFPDGESALMLVVARLRHMAAGRWGTRRYPDMCRLREVTEVLTTAVRRSAKASRRGWR